MIPVDSSANGTGRPSSFGLTLDLARIRVDEQLAKIVLLPLWLTKMLPSIKDCERIDFDSDGPPDFNTSSGLLA
jgi:hypothetical protein